MRTRSRSLRPPEIDYASDVFADSVDYDAIRITRGSLCALGSPVTLGATIHLKAAWGLFVGDGLELTARGRRTLIHEMAHVWQYQHGGWAYVPRSLLAQVQATARGGARGGAYDWQSAVSQRRPWARWNPEQQARLVEDYNRLLRMPKLTAAQSEVLDTAAGYLEYIRRGQGAPTWR